MAGNKPDGDMDAAELLQNAKEVPRPGEGGPGFSLPTMFGGGMPGMSPFLDKDTPQETPGMRIRMKCVSRTFTMWRPYEGCDRCKRAISNGDVVLPENAGDYTCPHVQNEEYQETVNRILSGVALKQFEEPFMLKNGLRGVHLIWLEPDEDAVKEIQEKKKKQEDLPYPPRPDKVFSQPVEEDPATKK